MLVNFFIQLTNIKFKYEQIGEEILHIYLMLF